MFDHLNISEVGPLPTPHELLTALAPTPAQKRFVDQSRKTVRNILSRTDPRLLIIVGPCSIHDITAAKEYASKLLQLSKSIDETCHVVMRVYFEKPRTARGWKGLLYDPKLDQTHDIALGLHLTRKLLLDLNQMGIATAAEFLDPLSAYYFGDLVTWGCIGARTASSQIHRQMASSLLMPIAFKNATDGNVDVAVNSVISAAESHTYIGINLYGQVSSIQTQGNKDCHIVLRGGETGPNYDPESITRTLNSLVKAGLPPRLLIDCSHDNSLRRHREQLSAFRSVINQVAEGNHNICGILLESNLYEGNQAFATNPSQLKYGVSITDSCLDWDTTEHLLMWGHAHLKKYDGVIQEIPNDSHYKEESKVI